MTSEKYLAIRDSEVRKSNDLIQKSRFSLPVKLQKIMLYIISQIKPWDEEFKTYEFYIPDFLRACGLSNSGKNYSDLKDALESLRTRKIFFNGDNRGWMHLPDGRSLPVYWLEKVWISEKSGTIQVKISEELRPYLLKLTENYTRYEMIYTFQFKSGYSIRLYELAKSIHFHDLEEYRRQYSPEELAVRIGAEKYNEYRDFKSKALKPAIEEINKWSDKNISFEEIKSGRKVTAIVLIISSKDTLETAALRDRIEKELGTDQMTLWDQMKERGVV